MRGRANAWTALAVPVGCLLAAAPASGDRAALGLADVAVLQDGAGSARILFKADPGALGSVAVGRATVRFPLAGLPEARVLRLRVHPVTRAWTPAEVDWNAPWSRPGGDFEEGLYSIADLDLSRGPATVELDVTSILKEILEAGMFADGFLLTVARGEGPGIPVADLGRLAGLGTGSLEVLYRNVPARARGT